MRRFILFVLALLPALASAQLAPPAHWPIIGETRDFTTGKHGADDAGHRFAAWRYLSADGFRWVDYTAALRRDKVLSLTPMLDGETPAAWANRMWSSNAPLPCSDTAIKSICDTAAAALAKIEPPAPPAFAVAKNGTTPTRPVYSLDLATRTVGALVPGLRAPVGADCACWTTGVRKGNTAYCPWASAAADTRSDQVTVCTAK